MSTLLRRELAPLSDAAWSMIDEEAARILKGNLSARALVDFNGPHGLTQAALNLGRVKPVDSDVVKGVAWGLREVQPLAEICVAFTLSLADLDQLARGGSTPDLSAVVGAAQKAALFEEKAIYFGLPQGGGQGILADSAQKSIPLPADAEAYVAAVEAAVHAIQKHGIAGPYHLVLGRHPFLTLAIGDTRGYPLRKRVGDLLYGGTVRWSPAIDGAAVISGRGGDYEFTVGQDYAIGYSGCEGDAVSLYLTASFAFRVLEPAAAVALKPKTA